MGEITYVGLGSNLGDKLQNCLEAIERINQIHGCNVITKSPFYRTDPVGVDDQDWFVNGVIQVEVELSPLNFLAQLLLIERNMGRIRRKRWDSRTIDLDILLFGQRIISQRDLIIPHPRLHMRRFALIPLVDIAPDLRHPIIGLSIKELLERCEETGQGVYPMENA